MQQSNSVRRPPSVLMIGPLSHALDIIRSMSFMVHCILIIKLFVYVVEYIKFAYDN